MLIQKWMSSQVITVDANDSLGSAIRLMKGNNVPVLPVMENNKLVGIVTKSDMKLASASDATTIEIHGLLYLIDQIKARDIMTADPLTVPYNFTIEEAAEILTDHNISALPVIGIDGHLVGIITRKDIFKVILSRMGLKKPGVVLALRVKDSPGSTKAITDIIDVYGGRLASILSSYDEAPEGYGDVYVRAYNLEHERLPHLLEQLRNTATLRYMIDDQYKTREIYKTDWPTQAASDKQWMAKSIDKENVMGSSLAT